MRLPSIVAAPLYIQLGSYELYFTPLSIRDLGTYENWALHAFEGNRTEVLTKADESIDGLLLLLWLSIRKFQPNLSKGVLINALRIENAMSVIDEVVLPYILGSDSTLTSKETSSVNEDTDWSWVFRVLAELYQFSPNVVADMTVNQIMVYLLEDPLHKKTVRFDSLIDATQYIAELRRNAKIASNN